MDISKRAIDIILMSGQSNMAGRGGIRVKHLEDGSVYKEWDRIVPSECEAEKGTVLRLKSDLEWEEAREPLHEDIDTGKICGVGPGLVFATTVLQYCKALKESVPAIGLVPCAVGGTQIKKWEKGGHLYDQMIRRAKVASKRGTLQALLWYQGESDTLAAENAVEFQQRLKTLITNVRSDLHFENLPVIQVGITAVNHPFPELLEKVRQAQLALELPGVFYVDASGLPLLEDNIHLNLEAQVKLGKMLADIYIKFILWQGHTDMDNAPYKSA